MVASHPHLFQQSVTDESEIHKLVKNCFLPDRTMLQWRPATGEEIPTPNMKEIVVFSSFQRGFGLLACEVPALTPQSLPDRTSPSKS
jgi:hypothetical protein